MDYWAILIALMKLGMTAVVAGLAGYFGSYLKRKGENRAMQEDIQSLVKQVGVVTRTTEEIKTELSDKSWDRQRQWELKRDILFEAMRALGNADAVLLSMQSTFALASQNRDDDENWISRKSEALARWTTASAAVDGAKSLIPILCGAEVYVSFSALCVRYLDAAHKIFNRDLDNYKNDASARMKMLIQLERNVRKELGLPDITKEEVAAAIRERLAASEQGPQGSQNQSQN